MKPKNLPLLLIAILLMCLASIPIYFIPPIHQRLSWRMEEVVLRIKYTLNPPAKAVFVPQEGEDNLMSVQSTMEIATFTPDPTATPTQSVATTTPMPTLTSTIPVTPLPESVSLKGVRYEDQHGRWNYCAPANLAMALSYWGWQGNRDIVGPYLKPDDKDKNVMPYEMIDYIEGQTNLQAKERVGGNIELLKRFLASGYPVLVEKGTYLRDLTGVVSWMGHYQVVTGYNDVEKYFITQDSFVQPDHKVSYDEFTDGWRAFNYTYVIIYPPENETEVVNLLGVDADETSNYQNAALIASNEIYGLSGINQYFAWFNRGSNLVKLQDYAGAATAYDEAFAIYPTIPETERPWRMLWYQTGPYFAYFFSGRHYDVLYLADGTLNAMQGDRNLEESYYWRAMARSVLGDTQGAIEDFRASLKYHPDFEPAIYQLNLLGVEYP